MRKSLDLGIERLFPVSTELRCIRTANIVTLEKKQSLYRYVSSVLEICSSISYLRNAVYTVPFNEQFFLRF